MKKPFLLLILVIVMAHGLEESLTLMSLEQLNSLDTSQYDCSRPRSEFIQLENSLTQWQDLLEHKDYIEHDIKLLQGIQTKIGHKATHKSVIKSLDKLKLPKTSTKIGLAEVEALKEQCGCLKKSDNDCDALFKLLSYFILSLRNVQSQCQSQPITVIKIKGKIHDLQVITAGCGGTIDIKGDEGCESKPTEQPVEPTVEPTPDDVKDVDQPKDEETTTTDETEEGETTNPEPTTDEPTPNPTTEEGETEPTPVVDEEGETTQQPTEEGETTTPNDEEGETTAGAEEGETPNPTDEEETSEPTPVEEEGETPNVPNAEEEGETATVPNVEEEGETANVPATEEEGETASVPNTEEEGETASVPNTEEEGETANVPATEEEGETASVPAAEEETSLPNEEGETTSGPEEAEDAAVTPGEENEEAFAEPNEEIDIEVPEEGSEEITPAGETSEESTTPATEEGSEETTTPSPAEGAEEGAEEFLIDEPTEEIDIIVPEEEEACEEEETEEVVEEFDEEVEETVQSEEQAANGEDLVEEESFSAVGDPTYFEEEGISAVGDPTYFEEESSDEPVVPVEESDEPSVPSEESEESEPAPIAPSPDDEVLPDGCRKVPEDVLDVSWESTEPIAVSDLPVTESQIIGLSFYFRWLSKFPAAVPEGLDQENKFFVAGLGNALKFYVGKGGFHFSSFDESGTETYRNAGHGDIEGQWVLVYFGIQNQKVTGFAQIDGGDIETVEFDINFNLEETYSLVIGGPDGNVPSFNGQIARVFAFNDELYTESGQFTQFVKDCYRIPENIYSGKRLTIPIEKERTFSSTAVFDNDSVFENKKPMLPDEYSASGWFKWEPVDDQNIWHSGFRWTTNDQATNQNFRNLGDRGLSFFVGDHEHLQDHVAFCTYTYKTKSGKSKVNDCKMVKYGDKLTEWFYVYFGYSRHLNQAYGYIEFTHEMAQLEFKDIRHYYGGKMYFYLGQDKFYPPFNGKVQGFMLNFFDGSYRTSSYDYTFGYFPRPVYEYDDSKELIPAEPKKKCHKVVDITVENASDVLCALSNYLSAVAQGHDPASDPKAETFCFCLVYEEENATPDLLMLAQLFGGRVKVRQNDVNSSIKKLISQQKNLVK